MKSIFIITTLLTTLSTQKFIANPNYSTWKLKHGKKLSNLNESTQTVQQKSFLENLQIIEQHNKEVSDFELGFNDYSHIAKEDFVKFYCKTALPKQLLPDRPKLARTKTFNNFTVNNLPETFSWRDVLKPVKNQGGVCGSCWAFATMAMLEGVNKKKNGKWSHELSPQYLVDCDRHNFGCGGGWPTTALKFLKFKSQNEAPTAENYPYKAKNDKCKMHDMPKVKLNINDIFEFKFKGDDRQMRLRLVNHGPLVIAMYVNDKSGLFQNYKKGIFYERGCPSSCKDVNHSMLLVGYGVTNDVPRKRFYLILNSWGESWGEKGYVRMAAERGNNCNTACYGIVSN